MTAGDAPLADLWRAWPIAGPWRLTPLTGGTNSHVWRAELADGAAWGLRLIAPERLPRERYATRLLAALPERALSFAVPRPLLARDGAIFAPVPGDERMALLWPMLPGAHPDHTDRALARAAGAALGELDRALAGLPDLTGPEHTPAPPFTDLAALGDPLALVASLPVLAAERAALGAWLGEVRASGHDLAARLPRQVVHRDVDPSNVLVAAGRVVAVLDFEFAGPDLRALDLAVALSWWPARLLGSGDEWPIIAALGQGYTAAAPLNSDEIAALPALLRLRDAASLLHRIRRFQAGYEMAERMAERVAHWRWREAWLAANATRLLDLAAAWR